MTEQTPLDLAHQTMNANPEDTAARMRFFERLADSEVFLLLQKEATGDDLLPEIIEDDGVKYVLVFDREERLADFVGDSAHHAAVSGRVVAAMLAGQGVGIGLNLGVAPSSILIPAQAMEWLCEMLEFAPDEISEKPVSINPPTGLPEQLLQALDAKLATAASMAKSAYLVSVAYENGRKSNMLAIIDAVPAAQGAMAKAINEALSFNAEEDAQLDVVFFQADDPVCALFKRVGLRFDLPEPKLETGKISAPGSDPDSPPILR